ncbi:MAG: hypothetical protein Q9217_003457 [Psora testacea]
MYISTLISKLTTFTTLLTCSFAVSTPLQQILNDAYKPPLYTYPTSLTQDIIPVPIHSHNDYWRPLPFYSALSVGAVSIEADVWLSNATLYVGHERSALTRHRTFESLYINPILDILKRQNPDSTFLTEGATHNGVYDTAAGQTLYLFVDVKTDGAETWPYVLKALQPLYSGGWLSTINSTNKLTSRPITIIGTGNTPLSQVQTQMPRYAFYDGPITTLNSTFSNITSQISPIASTDFTANFGTVSGTSLNDTQVALLRQQVKTAHAKGIKLRYWNQPAWPISTRNGLWRQLRTEGVDLLNVDDLEAGAGFSDYGNYW